MANAVRILGVAGVFAADPTIARSCARPRSSYLKTLHSKFLSSMAYPASMRTRSRIHLQRSAN
jgi:hypothetical protein